MSTPAPAEQQQRRSTARRSELSTLVVTNIAKLVGVYIAYHEAVVLPSARSSVLAICLAFVMGAQAAENAVLRLIDRMFERD